MCFTTLVRIVSRESIKLELVSFSVCGTFLLAIGVGCSILSSYLEWNLSDDPCMLHLLQMIFYVFFPLPLLDRELLHV